MGCTQSDLQEFGTEFERWRGAAQMPGKWGRRLKDGAEVFETFTRNGMVRRSGAVEH